MSNVVIILKHNSTGMRTIVMDNGEKLIFKEGYSHVSKDQDVDYIENWLNKNAKSYGVTAATDLEVAELEAFEASKAVKVAAELNSQAMMAALLSGTAPVPEAGAPVVPAIPSSATLAPVQQTQADAARNKLAEIRAKASK